MAALSFAMQFVSIFSANKPSYPPNHLSTQFQEAYTSAESLHYEFFGILNTKILCLLSTTFFAMAPTCCMSRKSPSSPDEQPPRQVAIQLSPTKNNAPHNLSFGSASTLTILSKPGDKADLSAIFFDAQSLAESIPGDLKSKKSTATIKVVTVGTISEQIFSSPNIVSHVSSGHSCQAMLTTRRSRIGYASTSLENLEFPTNATREVVLEQVKKILREEQSFGGSKRNEFWMS